MNDIQTILEECAKRDWGLRAPPSHRRVRIATMSTASPPVSSAELTKVFGYDFVHPAPDIYYKRISRGMVYLYPGSYPEGLYEVLLALEELEPEDL